MLSEARRTKMVVTLFVFRATAGTNFADGVPFVVRLGTETFYTVGNVAN
jgi:hypothetical protein